MKILALDDSEPALRLLSGAIREARPEAEVFEFDKPSMLLAFAGENICDIAFLDIEVWGMDGLAVAKRLKERNPNTNIIFVTAYSEYASRAFSVYPSGYILKPVTTQDIERELENLRYPIDEDRQAGIFIQTFGSFEVFVHGKPLKFTYSKAKELLAYLVDRHGAVVSTNELCAILWEDNERSLNTKVYVRKLISELSKTLMAAGADGLLHKHRTGVAVSLGRFRCDSYDFEKGSPQSVNAYRGEYMAQYSWAEFTAGSLY